MKILAFEFSSPQRSVAVVQSGEAGIPTVVSEVVETGGISTKPLAMVEAVLQESKLEREQVQCVVVGLGPGSYTGIRTAIALAQGWQLARDVKLLGISSAEAIAVEAQATGITGRVAVAIDAQRGEFYLGVYDVTLTSWCEVEPLRLARAEEVQFCHDRGARIAGPDVSTWFPAGRQVFPRAGVLGRLALGRTDFVPGETLEPIYLRPTTFVKAREGR